MLVELAFGLGGMHTNYWGSVNSAVESGLIPNEVLKIYKSNVRENFLSFPGTCLLDKRIVLQGKSRTSALDALFGVVVTC